MASSFNPQFAVINAIRMAYAEAGSPTGQTLLFIHGLGENMQTWAKTVDGLKGSYHCIALDLPGHGLSESGNYPYSPFFFAEIIASFIKHQEIEKVGLVGHSLGGQVAIITALAQPILIDKLVLIAPAGFETFNEKDKKWITSHANNYGSPLQSFDFFPFWPANKTPVNEVYKATVAGMLAEPVFDHLPMVSQPVLVIFGEDDPFIPNRFLHPMLSPRIVAEAGVNRMPNAKLIMIPHAGHFVHLERAGEVSEAIKDFK